MLPASPKEQEPSSLLPDQTCRHFSLDEIRAATQNFNEELVVGRGGFGKVYKGHINHGSATVVAIKRLNSNSHQGAPEFRAEVETLSTLRHCNLVSLIGYCNKGKEMILVYDYMPHGTLEDCLHEAAVPLSWLQRLKICLGAARGLDYLHTGTGTQHGVIHRDVKSSNILLDENFAAKISDFGLAKIGPTNQTCTYVSTGVKGTFGYMDPCYFYTGKLTRKSDVYAFGVVLLEVICGKRAVDSSLDEDQWGLAIWARDHIKEGKLNRITDSRLRGQISSDCLKQFTRIACHCLHNQPNQRPTMADIIAKLELILSVQVKLDSPVTDRKFTNKLRWFFPAKVQQKASMATPTASSEGEHSDKAAERLIHFDGSLFSVEDLLQASAVVIGKSNYWKCYKLMLLGSGEQVLVRRMKTKLFLTEDIFLRKIHALGKLFHPNILGPKAYYHGKGDTLYITDSKQNGSISSLLHTNSKDQLPKPLDWSTRRSIIIGITRGLVYLHTQENIVHGYLTSENVLLDGNYNPFIVDVGLLLLLNRDARPKSPLNHAPELLKFQDANMKTDVYGLGLIMLELLTRKSANSEKEVIDFLAWVKLFPGEVFNAEVFDPELKTEKSDIKQELVRILDLAMQCVSLSPDARPTADQVLQQLESEVYLPSTTITGNYTRPKRKERKEREKKRKEKKGKKTNFFVCEGKGRKEMERKQIFMFFNRREKERKYVIFTIIPLIFVFLIFLIFI